jgi:hypothetical protein
LRSSAAIDNHNKTKEPNKTLAVAADHLDPPPPDQNNNQQTLAAADHLDPPPPTYTDNQKSEKLQNPSRRRSFVIRRRVFRQQPHGLFFDNGHHGCSGISSRSPTTRETLP